MCEWEIKPVQSSRRRCAPSLDGPCWPGTRRRGKPACQSCVESVKVNNQGRTAPCAIAATGGPRKRTGRVGLGVEYAPVMCLGGAVGTAEHLAAVGTVASNLEGGGWALRRVGRHGRLGLGAVGRGWCVGGGGHGNVVDDAELAALLGRPVERNASSVRGEHGERRCVSKSSERWR